MWAFYLTELLRILDILVCYKKNIISANVNNVLSLKFVGMAGYYCITFGETSSSI